jgi:hypothetical protein
MGRKLDQALTQRDACFREAEEWRAKYNAVRPAADLELLLAEAHRTQDEQAAQIISLQADVREVEQSAEHWHGVAAGYVVKVKGVIDCLRLVGGATSEAAESELVNATPKRKGHPDATERCSDCFAQRQCLRDAGHRGNHEY